MSLKSFHIIFIGFAVLLTIGFAVWAIQSYVINSNTMMLVTAIASVITGTGLILYGVRFLKKLKHVSFL